MRHSLMTENLPSMMPSEQFPMMHHTSQDSTSAAALTSELIHASFMTATQTRQDSRQTSETLGCSIKKTDSNNIRKPVRSASCIVEPTMSHTTLANIEYSIHTSPRRLTRDLATVFPNINLEHLLVVPTFQKCKHEMVAWDAEIAKEKDDRLEDFIRWSTALHQGLEKLGYWSDMTDPASGFPSFGERGRDVYPDVEGCQLLLKYDFQNAGCCKILLHPNWGSKIYPATFFTTAPVDVLQNVIRQVEQEYSGSF